MNYLALGLLMIGGIILTLGDLIMKNWVESNKWYVFTLGLFVWLIGLVFLAFSFKYKNIAVASILFILFNVLTLSLVGLIYFKEKYTGLQIIGMIVSIIGIVVLELAD